VTIISIIYLPNLWLQEKRKTIDKASGKASAQFIMLKISNEI
jgi:hypothetical protein